MLVGTVPRGFGAALPIHGLGEEPLFEEVLLVHVGLDEGVLSLVSEEEVNVPVVLGDGEVVGGEVDHLLGLLLDIVHRLLLYGVWLWGCIRRETDTILGENRPEMLFFS